ncbi:hypothetical protein OOJ91_34135 [Micromonospora lupini]|uniref:hypothetical protein n=1 Tax=Micromonospora lupini TaxID=285679 RepID=UPI00224CACA8|nr:hypothetical protein [Micromonospora lupini]MCX5070889.1 hypothetical protein [Micromonospora lupini]
MKLRLPRGNTQRTSLALNLAAAALTLAAFTAPVPTGVSHGIALTSLAIITVDLFPSRRFMSKWMVALQATVTTAVYVVAAFYLHDQGFVWLSRLALLGAAVSVTLGVLLTHPQGHLILGRPADKHR